jgi:cobalt-zinc-cadmium efflux system protein
VLVAAIVTMTTGWHYADVVVGVLISLWILPRAVSLARAALRILTETSPKHVDVDELRAALLAVDGVASVHDLHVWTLVPGKDMATAHVTSDADARQVLAAARAVLTERGLPHATIQVEPPEAQGHCEEHANW